MEKIRIGVSTCLMGEPVRYDGGHAQDRYVTDTLGRYVKLVPVCPEMGAGFGVPREPIRLVGDPASPRLKTVNTNRDLTNSMMIWARKRVRELEGEDLSGFIFKSKSPSCGMERVKVYDKTGRPVRKGTGLFAREFMAHFPLLPVEEDARFHDPRLRKNFIERIFTLQRWRDTRAGRKSVKKLTTFHAAHKLLILSHSTRYSREMGRLVTRAKGKKIAEVYARYESLLMEALRLRATVNKNTNALQHMMGYFRHRLAPDEKQELLEVIRDYHDQLLPLIVPVTLFKHYARKYEQPWLETQFYLSPHPLELKLRNHV